MSKLNSMLKMQGAGLRSQRAKLDYYTTNPLAVDALLSKEQFQHHIWEPACGTGNLSKRLEHFGYEVRSTDLISYRYGTGGIDFLDCWDKWDGDIATNPPYDFNLPERFARHGLLLLEEGAKLALFLRLNFLESIRRRRLFDYFPPAKVLVFSPRINTWKDGVDEHGRSSCMAFAWFVWIKGQKSKPVVEWIP